MDDNFLTMNSQEPVDVFIYRIRENGLEVFLSESDSPETAGKLLSALHTLQGLPERLHQSQCIELDAVDGHARKTIAVEADWHELPSLRALIYEDYRVVKEKARQKLLNLIPNMEKGAFVAVKEVLKRVMPEQYGFLKELKDVVVEKNQAKYI